MGKTFRFLFRFIRANLAVLAGIAAVLILGSWLTGVPQGRENIFGKYYMTFPVFVPLFLFLFSYTSGNHYLHLALSFGGRRRDYFLALQGEFLLYTGASVLLQIVLAELPHWFSWAVAEELAVFVKAFSGGNFLTFPLTCMVSVLLGTVVGLVASRSRVAGAILISVAIFGWLAVIAAWTVSGFLAWPAIPTVLTVGLVAALAAGEWYIHRETMRFVVR